MPKSSQYPDYDESLDYYESTLNVKTCPTCRESSTYVVLNKKVFIIMKEFLNIKDNIREYIKLHSDCESSQKLIKSLIQCAPPNCRSIT